MSKTTCRFLSLILVVALILSTGPMPAQAVSDSLTVRVSEATGVPGADVSVVIGLEDNPGIAALKMKVVYSNILTLESVTYNEDLGGLYQDPQTLTSPVTLAWFSGTKNFTGSNAVFATLRFKVSENAAQGDIADISITYNQEDIYNIEDQDVKLNVINGSVTVLTCVPGDINGDGSVNMRDLTRFFQYLANWDVEVNTVVLDVNGDGNVNMRDLTRLFQYLANWDVQIFPIVNEKCEHELVAVPYKAPTDTESGNIAYWYCPKCGKYFSDAEGNHVISYDSTIIPALSSSENYIVFNIPREGDEYMRGLEIDNPNTPYYDPETGKVLRDLHVSGYDFLGRFNGPGNNATQIREIPKGTTGRIELYAHWSEVEYDIIYRVYETPLHPIIDTSYLKYTVSKGKLNLPNPTLYNYVFLGWYGEDGKEVTEIPVGTTGDVVLNAYYTSKRNLTRRSQTADTDPVIIEDQDQSVLYFVYKIGTIENVPLSDPVWTIQGVSGLGQQVKRTTSTRITNEEGIEIAESIARSTTDSHTWTLASGWENETHVNEDWAAQHGKTVDEADTLAKSVTGTYSITDFYGGNSSDTKNDGTTSLGYNSKTSGKKDSQKYDVKDTEEISASIGNPKVAQIQGKFNLSHENEDYRENSAQEHSGTDTTTINTHSHVDTNSWSNTTQRTNTINDSESKTLRNVISEIVSEEKHVGESYINTGSESNSYDDSVTNSEVLNTSHTVVWKTEILDEYETTITLDGKSDGWYRLVTAGTFHVFAVVGYNINTQEYFVTTLNILDDRQYAFLDYSPYASFDDSENGVLPFEVPYFVYEYTHGMVARTDGLLFATDTVERTAKVFQYNGTDTEIIIPSYISVGGLAYKVTEINASAFQGKPIRSIILGDYIDEIPAYAFAGCSHLEEIYGGFSKIGKSAFSECSNLKHFNFSSRIVNYEEGITEDIAEIGENAFFGVPHIEVTARSARIAQEAILSGAQKLTLDISGITDSDGLTLNVPEMKCFELLGGRKSYRNLKLESYANETILKELTITSNGIIPLTIYSGKLTLDAVSASGSGFVLLLQNDGCEVSLIRDSAFVSDSEKTIVSKNPKFTTVVSNGTIGYLKLTGDVYVCGKEQGGENLVFTSGKIQYIGDGEFASMTNGIVITFDPNEGTIDSELATKTVFYGQLFGELPTPVRENYNFIGWYTERSGGDWVTDTSIVTQLEDVTLYAHWEKNTYVITFDANGGTVTTDHITAYAATAIGMLPTASRDYYHFDGWFTDPTSGIEVTENTVFNDAQNITLYAHWTLNPESGWVLASEIPNDAQIVDRKWTYTKTTTVESTASSMSGYTKIGERWRQTGTGVTNYASFPSGFDTGHWIYKEFAKSAYQSYENETSKRDVNNAWAGYVYWHWMYDCGTGAGTPNRAIYNKYGYGPTNNYLYKFFGAFTSTNGSYNSTTDYCNNLGIRNYIIPERTAYADCQGATRWFRFDYYKSSYVDYEKIYTYQLVENLESYEEIHAGTDGNVTVSNVQSWVRYRAK